MEMLQARLRILFSKASFTLAAAVFFALQAILSGSLQATIGIPGGPLNVIAVTPDNASTVYAGTGVGIFKSENGEDIWSPVNQGLTTPHVYDIAIDPDTPALLYGATEGGVYKTTDGGVKWSITALKSLPVYALAIHPVTSTYLVAGTPDGVLTSINSGAVWTKEPTGPQYVYAVAAASDNSSSVLYAGSFGEGVYKSTDFGVTWSRTGSGPQNVHHLAVHPTDSQIVYAGTQSGMYKTTTGGSSWTALSAELSSTPVYSIAISSSSPSTLYAATDKGAYKITKAGNSWERINQGMTTTGSQGPFVREIVIDQNHTATLYAGTYSGNIYDVDIYKSTNSGSSWTQINRELSNTGVYCLAFDAEDTALMFAGTSTVGVLKSTNGGLSWQEATEGLTSYLVRALAVNPDTSDVYAGTASGLFLSTDAGDAWAEISPRHEIYAVAVPADTPDNIYIGTNNGVFLSSDEGDTWSALNNNLTNPNILCMLFHPEDSDTLFVGTKGDGVFKSTSAGESWTPLNDGLNYLEVQSLAIDPIRPFTLYAGVKSGGVYRSAAGADSWEPAGEDVSGLSVLSIALNPDDPDIVYAGTEGRGFYQSTDAGESWESIDEDLSDTSVYNVSIDPQDSQTVFAATRGDIKIYTFNTPPDVPSAPSPADSAVNQPLDTTLSWTCADPDAGDSLTYEVYFGTDPNPDTNTPAAVDAAAYDPGALQLSQTYVWKVVALDGHGAETEGDVWRFYTSISNPPRKPSSPSPPDKAEDQPIDISLSWSGGDTDNADIVTYDVYFGTADPPPLAREGVSETSYTPSRFLRPFSTYYWKIVSRDNNGLETEGDIWSFSTGYLPQECIVESILGSSDPGLQTLRRIRDQHLLTTADGAKLVMLYYTLSPELTAMIKRDAVLKQELRALLDESVPLLETWLQQGTCRLPPSTLSRVDALLDRCARTASPAARKLLILTKPLIKNLCP